MYGFHYQIKNLIYYNNKNTLQQVIVNNEKKHGRWFVLRCRYTKSHRVVYTTVSDTSRIRSQLY